MNKRANLASGVLALMATFLVAASSLAETPRVSTAVHGDDTRGEDAIPLKVISQTFGKQGCSQVCPLMSDICTSEGGKPGRCWCDENAGGTVGHIVCEK
jgi:hypothetical protein